MKRLGQMLKTWREKNDLTQREMARTLGVLPSTVCRLENGKESDTKTIRRVMLWVFGE